MAAKKKSRADSSAIDKIIGQNVRIQRLAKRVSQSQLGKHLGLTFQQIQKYENGKNRIGSGRLLQIAEFLEIKPMSLFSGIEIAAPGDQVDVIEILAEPQCLRLLQAFKNIRDSAVRRTLVTLVENISMDKEV
jgi:transcriptional regulator with XRE-family HTH domain